MCAYKRAHAQILYIINVFEYREVFADQAALFRMADEVLRVHYCDVIMGPTASQITSLTSVYSIVYSGTYQRKHQSSASLAFVRGIHRGPVNSPHKWPVTRKMFPFDDVIMYHGLSGVKNTSWQSLEIGGKAVNKSWYVLWGLVSKQPNSTCHQRNFCCDTGDECQLHSFEYCPKLPRLFHKFNHTVHYTKHYNVLIENMHRVYMRDVYITGYWG